MTRIQKDWVETYFEYGVDVQNRRIFLLNDICTESTRTIIQGIKLLEAKGTDPVEIYVSTPGGEIYDMFGIYDMILNCPCHVKTIGVGHVMSAGPLLLTAGDEKLCYRNTSFMVHSWWWSRETNAPNHKNDVKHNEVLMHRWGDLMEQGSKTPAKRWIKMSEAKGIDYHFDAPDALELGLIERII